VGNRGTPYLKTYANEYGATQFALFHLFVTDHGAKLHHLDYPRLVSGCRVPEIFAGKRSRAETPSRMAQRISHT
jgi:hypothetical protein